MQKNNKKIAFVVPRFPVISETFIISQIADLIDREIEIEVFSFARGDEGNISEKFNTYNMLERVHYLDTPGSFVKRFFYAILKVIHIMFKKPALLYKIFVLKQYRSKALSLQLLFQVQPFINKKFDLIHCHFGNVANNFLIIKEIMGLKQKMITTFYGWDASRIFNETPASYYDNLKKECEFFFVMSSNMKDRIIEKGFDRSKIAVLPVGIDLKSYPFNEREFNDGEAIRIVSVGRFTEKKGFDDLLRAISIVKKKSKRLFRCYIIGDGKLKDKLLDLTERLKLNDVVEYKGYMKHDDIIKCFTSMNLFAQPSKTDRHGDME